MTNLPTVEQICRHADLPEATRQAQLQGLALLLAEMQALASLLPGVPSFGATSNPVTEADFDNMPV